MATDTADIVKQGYIRLRSQKFGIWQKRWIVLRHPTSKGPCRLEKYYDERNARSNGAHKVAVLTAVTSVTRLPETLRRHAFSVTFQDGSTRSLACNSDLEADTWVKLLIQESAVPQPGIATGEPDVLSPGIQKELQEQFHVYLLPTPKLDFFGECLLQVTHENIYLWDVNNPRVKLVAWPLTALRRYGSDPSKFTFEAGRHCSTGEGMFVFHTAEGERIYCKVHQATLAIAEAHHRLRRQNDQPNSGDNEPCLPKRVFRSTSEVVTTTELNSNPSQFQSVLLPSPALSMPDYNSERGVPESTSWHNSLSALHYR